MKKLERLSLEELQSVEGTVPAPSGEPWERFIAACLEWAGEWIQANDDALSNSAIPATQAVLFVFCESPDLEKQDLKVLGTGEEPLFRRSVSQDTQGLILCNENFHQMLRIVPAFSSANEELLTRISEGYYENVAIEMVASYGMAVGARRAYLEACA